MLTRPPAGELRAAVRSWIADDPDPADRAELSALLQADDLGGLAERFAEPLTFGTAGIGARWCAARPGTNRAVVRRAASGPARVPSVRPAGPRPAAPCRLSASTRAAGPGRSRPRPPSVLTGAGRANCVRRPVPTPCAGLRRPRPAGGGRRCTTASHNPRDDNGVKVDLSDGAQIIPPVDAGIVRAAAQASRRREVPLGGPGQPLGPADLIDAILDAVVPAALPA